MNRILAGYVILAAACMSGAYAQSGGLDIQEEVFRPGQGTCSVVLSMDAGEIRVEKAEPGQAGSVHVECDPEKFRTKIDWDEGKNRMNIRVHAKNWHHFSKYDEETHASVILLLPADADLQFKASLKAGEARFKLGGLRLVDFRLSVWAGESEVEFQEPNPAGMKWMEIHHRVGECRLIRLGNARFQKADINSGIGELEADFTGDLVSGSMARVDLDIGSACVRLPVSVGNRVSVGGLTSFMSSKEVSQALSKRGNRYFSDNYEQADVKFSCRITPGLGELSIETE